jgi:hypothetical protein
MEKHSGSGKEVRTLKTAEHKTEENVNTCFVYFPDCSHWNEVDRMCGEGDGSTFDLSLTKPPTTHSNTDTGQSVQPYRALPQQDVIPESLRDQIICSSRAVRMYLVRCSLSVTNSSNGLGSPHNCWVGVLHRMLTLAA